MTLILKNISLGFNDKETPLAVDINIDTLTPQFIALVGRNGTGKSTLLRSLAGLVRPLAGQILLDGQSLFDMRPNQRAQRIAFVSTESVRVAHLRAWDVVALGRTPYSSWSGALSENDNKIVEQALQRVAMTDFADVNIDRLSDGERGRVMIARALAQECDVILLDEPTAFLDLPNRYHIMNLLRNLAHDAGKIIILSTHELNLAQELADTLWVLADKKITVGPPDEIAQSEALQSIMRL